MEQPKLHEEVKQKQGQRNTNERKDIRQLESWYYTPNAFDERVTFQLQRAWYYLVCVRLLHCMRVRLRNDYTRPSHAKNATNAQGSDWTR